MASPVVLLKCHQLECLPADPHTITFLSTRCWLLFLMGMLLVMIPMALEGLPSLWQPATEPNGQNLSPVLAPVTYTPGMRQP